MCGIVGFKNSPINLDLQSVRDSMLSSISHRGPDENGSLFTANGLFLGHLRLAIHDLSSSGSQPMTSHSGRYTIVFNGEIYNYKSLKKHLESRFSVIWRGKSDTEVLLECISHLGLDASLTLIDGMFSFALFDMVQNELYLVRDRFGEKPLYVYEKNDYFCFASELRPIEIYAKDLSINQIAVSYQLNYSYIPDELSIYNEVYKILPGSYRKYVLTGESVYLDKIVEYWNTISEAITCYNSKNNFSLSDSIEYIEKSIENSVIDRMDSDVPFGAFLSGGIDSTCIVALMQKNSARKINTFSIGFHDKDYNEANFAKEVARHLGTDHNELYLTPKDIIDIIPRIHSIYDEPFSDSSQLPTYMVSYFARKKVTVALTGDSGDELFGGYNRHLLSSKLEKVLSNYPLSVRRVFSAIAHSLSPVSYSKLSSILNYITLNRVNIRNLGDKIHKLANVIEAKDGVDLYSRLINTGSSSLSNVECPSPFNENIFKGNNFSLAERMMLQDTVGYMRNDILTKVDRASMACSLETRVPFLSLDVFKAAWSTPIEHKIVNGVGKYPLRAIVNKYVPSHLVERPKSGFGIPIYQWLRTDLRSWAESLLSEDKLALSGCLDVKTVRHIWSEHLSGRKNLQYQLWNVLMFQQWYLSK